jgi:hypothetical protein
MANLSNINNKFLVTTGGNVLIGQTAAVGTSKLQVTGNATFAGNVIIHNSSNAPYIDFVENADTGDSKARITMDQIDTNNGTLFFATENAGTLFNQVKITQTGNLLLSNDAASFNTSNAKLNVLPASSGVYQQWNYSPSNDNFSLKLKETVTVGNVRYVFEQINNATTYPNTLVFNQGSIGIGTASPNEKLQLAGNLNAYAPGGIDAGLFASTAAGSTTIALRSNGVTHFNGGNVGIGTTSPSSKLQVSGDAYVTEEFGQGVAIANKVTTYGAEFRSSGASAQVFFGRSGNDIGSGAIGADSSYVFRVWKPTDFSQPFVIEQGGNVGIGTTSPFGKLSVNVTAGAPASSGNMTNGLTVHNTNGGRAIQLGINESGGYTYLQSAYVNNAGVAQPMAFFTGATEKMRIDSSGLTTIKRTGITGVAKADMTLQIGYEGNNGQNNLIGFGYNAQTNIPAYIGYTTTSGSGSTKGDLVFGTRSVTTNTAPSERMRIDSSGIMHIMGATPSVNNSFQLQYNSTAGTAEIYSKSTGGNTSFEFYTSDGGVTSKKLTIANDGTSTLEGHLYLKSAANQGQLFFGTADNQYEIFGGGMWGYLGYNTGGYHRFFTSGTERMKITNGGLIQASAGGGGFRVLSDSGNSSNLIDYYYNSSFNHGLEVEGDRGLRMYSNTGDSSAKLTFYTEGTERMRITSSGLLFVGDTTNNYGYNAHHIATNASQGYALIVRNSNTTTTNNSVIQLNQATTGSNGYFMICRQGDANSGTNRLFIFSNGNVQNANNSYGAISDERKKENIVDATPKLDKLMDVKVRNFNLIGEETKQIGVVAQELEQVFPGMISESKDPDSEDETLYKSVKYSVFVPILLKAIQELKADNDSLKARIETLENN